MTATLYPNLPMDDYVRDRVPAPSPTLSSSIAHRIISRSPLHGWARHPRLNPDWEQETNDAFDLGSAVHAVLLEGKRDILAVCDFADDWRSKDARAFRDEARAEGKIPLMPAQAAVVDRMVGAATRAILSRDLAGIGPLDAEQTIVWHEENAWLRCRPDLIARNGSVILSYKTTSAVAEPDRYVRNIIDLGYEMQAAFELRGATEVFGAEPKYVWIVGETTEPFAVSLIGMTPALREYAMERYDLAVERWTDCLNRNDWPGYPTRVCYVDVPGYAAAQWEGVKALNELTEAFA